MGETEPVGSTCSYFYIGPDPEFCNPARPTFFGSLYFYIGPDPELCGIPQATFYLLAYLYPPRSRFC